MSTAQKTKNVSTVETLAAKAPWTDKQGIGIKVYKGVIIFLEVVWILLRMNWEWIYGMYRFIVPVEPKRVDGEIVLITGTGHGIGREMALQFGDLGATVVCVDINPKGNKETLDMLKAKKQKAFAFECDVCSSESVAKMAAAVRKEVGEVTVLVNNAGIMPCKPFEAHTEKEIRLLFDVNIISHHFLVREFLPAMKERNRGHILAMSSMAGAAGFKFLAPYCASKFAVRGFMEALHEELREDPRDYSGIHLTCVCPYIVNTGLCKKPSIRFPSLMPIVKPEEAAAEIIDALRRNKLEISIPGNLLYLNAILRCFPIKCALVLKDFLNAGLDAHDD